MPQLSPAWGSLIFLLMFFVLASLTLVFVFSEKKVKGGFLKTLHPQTSPPLF
uniref:ATP synthase F0 subunit 8 n=1 Tax=Discus perspectivus TaxID=697275 RepID=UPI002176EA59|nr:ATP synthase F0 subunit 8 [Discus perspectivus]UUB71742.1 ATP synthase F0 subunit 8 [Discus perspectivus]